MKKLLPFIFSICFLSADAQIDNMVIVTTDGFRWEDVFNGMDSAIAVNPDFNQGNSAAIFSDYWSPDLQQRRKKLLPFIWTTMASNGQIYGNRKYNNNVDNSNPYWFSYPGYSEIFCGFVDTLVNSNNYKANPNTNVLEFINNHDAFKGKVAAFGAWDAFDRILNEKRAGFPVICGGDSCGGANPDAQEHLLNGMKHDSYTPFGAEEYLDVFTHYFALDFLMKKKPRVLYISYGETDEWAHAGKYHDYLDAAHHVDQWLGDVWNFLQSDLQYKNRTALFVTVDHGRGDVKKEQWTSHNNKIADSHQIWFAVMGPGIPAKGEIKTPAQFYQKQFAQTFAQLLGLTFTCEHPVGNGLKDVLMK